MTEGVHGSGAALLKDAGWIQGIVCICEAVTLLALAGMVTVIVVDVVTRNLFGFSLQLSDELSGYFLVVATFMAMPVALANDGFHKGEFLEGKLRPRTRLKFQIVVTILSLVVCLVIEWSLVRFVIIGFGSGSIAMTDLATPLWIPQAAMPIGLGLLSIVLAALIVLKIAQLRATSSDARSL